MRNSAIGCLIITLQRDIQTAFLILGQTARRVDCPFPMKGVKNLKKVKSYTGIWNVEKVLYSINDFNLPFPITFSQMAWFVLTEFVIILFADLPPLNLIEGAFLKYFGIPVALTWFMSQKTFDGKKPYSFLKSMATYAMRPKVTYAGKAVKLHSHKINKSITAVRSEIYVPDTIH